MVGGANAGSGAEAEEMAKQKVRGSACRRREIRNENPNSTFHVLLMYSSLTTDRSLSPHSLPQLPPGSTTRPSRVSSGHPSRTAV
eukprot:3645169-Rhodomonas_salina.2